MFDTILYTVQQQQTKTNQGFDITTQTPFISPSWTNTLDLMSISVCDVSKENSKHKLLIVRHHVLHCCWKETAYILCVVLYKSEFVTIYSIPITSLVRVYRHQHRISQHAIPRLRKLETILYWMSWSCMRSAFVRTVVSNNFIHICS